MSSKHKMLVDLPIGPRDLGEDIEVEIHFTYLPGAKASFDDPGWGPEVDFISAVPFCNGSPMKFLEYADLKQDSLNELAFNYLESKEGYREACATARDDHEAGREFAAKLRRDDR